MIRPRKRSEPEVAGVLADRALAALDLLLLGFEAAAERDPSLRDVLADPRPHLFDGLVTVLLRLVFTLYAEDHGLLPIGHAPGARLHGVRALQAQLQEHARAAPDALAGRFVAWSRIHDDWRALHAGEADGDLPARAGGLFAPDAHIFLDTPHVDDLTVLRVLEPLSISYRDLDVEQLGAVHEALIGHRVVRLLAPAVRLRDRGVWVTAAALLAVPPARRAAWLKDHVGMTPRTASRLADAVARARDEDAALQALVAARLQGAELRPAGRLVVQPGEDRRRSGAHYTPRALTGPIVDRALAPLLAALGPEPASARLLGLRICDPAIGGGAFLVAVVRALADHLVAAWAREGERVPDPVQHARRLVARRCVHGVDTNRLAVALARLSLWLTVRAPDLPLDFVDHALHHGDALAGLDLAQLRAFHWRPDAPPQQPFAAELDRALADAVALRRRLRDLADDASAARTRAHLRRDVDAAVARVRLLADLLLGAFFKHDDPRDRERERKQRGEAAAAWLRSGAPPPPALLAMQAELRARVPAFHWPIELPEVFLAAAMDAVVGNPPFLGGGQLSGTLGDAYLAWLLALHPGSHGNADLSAHFFRRADTLLGAHATIGLIATNTIGQGDTRTTGLQALLTRRGWRIHAAARDMTWPESGAAVTVSVVHLARGAPADLAAPILLSDPSPDDPTALVPRVVPALDSRLRPAPERPDPRPLADNAGLSFIGNKIYGQGFILTPAQRDALVAADPRNAERIFPYLGGEEVNTCPHQRPSRHVIDFGQLALADAERWPDLLAIVRERVRPERERLKDNPDGRRRKRNWWQFGRHTPALLAAIAPLPRCLVTAIVSKHVIFSFQPTDRVFSHKLFVFPLARWTALAVLQSRIHLAWAWLLCSTMRDAGINYAASDCFETFPFPRPDPRAELPELERLGERLDAARIAFMTATRQGLTRTYNALEDPACTDPRIVALRELHRELDRAVLRAYGWPDLQASVPACTRPRGPAERLSFETFEHAVRERLFALNAARAAGQRPS